MKIFGAGRVFRWAVISAAVGLLVTGCGGGGKGESAAGNDVAGETAAIIPATTKVLGDDTLLQLDAVSADNTTLTFKASTPQLEALESGDVLVVPITALTPDGLLRKVVTVSQANGGVVVTTEGAYLTDAIEQGEIAFSEPLTAADIEEATFIHEGIEFLPSPAPGSAAVHRAALNEMVLNVNDQLIQGLRFKGSLKFSITPSFTAKISSFSIKELSAKAAASEDAKIRLIGDYQLKADKEKEIGKIKFAPKVVFVGVVPVYIRPVLKFVVGASAGTNSSFTTGIEQSLSYTAGIERKNGAWNVINDLNKTFTYTPPTMEANLEAKGYITPRLVFYIYGVGGPFVGAEGYLKLTADINADPWCDLSAGIGGVAGVTGKILSVSLGEVEKELFTLETSLYQCKRPYMAVLDTADRSFSGVVGGPFDPATSNYVIRSKDGSVDWSAASDVSWLTIAPASGVNVTEPGFDTFTLSLNDNAKNLGKGTYKGTLTFTNTTNGEGNTKRYVYLTAREQSMTVEPGPDTYLLAAVPEGGDFSGHSVDFTLGSDVGTIDYTAASDADWLTVDPASGSVAEGAPVTVTLSVDNAKARLLPAKTQAAMVTFANLTNHKGDTVRNLFLQPLMNVSGGDLAIAYPEGGPYGDSHQFDIEAINEAIPWTAQASADWLVLSAGSGIAQPGSLSTLTLDIDDAVAGQLAPGNYTGVITLTNTGSGQFSDVTKKTVALTVKDPLSVSPATPLNFSGVPGGPYSPASAVYTLSSDFAVDFEAGADVNWLTLTPSSGQVSPGNPVTVQLEVNSFADLLDIGGYAANLTFAKTGGVRKEIARNVTLNINENPVCAAGPTNFDPPYDPSSPFSYNAFLDFVHPDDGSSCFFSSGYVGALEFQVTKSGSNLYAYVIDALGTGWFFDSVTPNDQFIPNYSNDRSLAWIPFDTEIIIDLTKKDGTGKVLGQYSGIFTLNKSPLSVEVKDFQTLP